MYPRIRRSNTRVMDVASDIARRFHLTRELTVRDAQIISNALDALEIPETQEKQMAERNYNVSGELEISAGKIISVEKGNVEKTVPTESKVCAFSLEVEGASLPIKILLKGALAEEVWTNELCKGMSMDSELRKTVVNVNAEFRELRPKELVVHNPTDLEFYRARAYRS